MQWERAAESSRFQLELELESKTVCIAKMNVQGKNVLYNFPTTRKFIHCKSSFHVILWYYLWLNAHAEWMREVANAGLHQTHTFSHADSVTSVGTDAHMARLLPPMTFPRSQWHSTTNVNCFPLSRWRTHDCDCEQYLPLRPSLHVSCLWQIDAVLIGWFLFVVLFISKLNSIVFDIVLF